MFISDIDVQLVQRLLHYTAYDLWLSEEDKDWHYPLLITIRDKTTRNWRERKTGNAARKGPETKTMKKELHIGMERRFMVFKRFLAGSGKCLDRFVLAWNQRHSNSHA